MNNFLTTSECKAIARHKLIGKYGMAVALCFLYFAINLVLSLMDSTLGSGSSFGSMILSMIFTMLTIALMAGSYYFCLNISRDRDYNITDLFVMLNPAGGLKGLSALIIGNILSSIICMLPLVPAVLCLYLYSTSGSIAALAPVPFLIIIGTIASVYLMLTYFFLPLVILDTCNEAIPAFTLMKACAGIVKGHRLKLFYMLISFIGWIILGILSMGIGFLWILPYLQTTICVFYNNISIPSVNETSNSDATELP